MLSRITTATLLAGALLVSSLSLQAEDEPIPGALDTKRIEKDMERSFDTLKMEVRRSFQELSMGVERSLNDRVEAIEEQFEDIAAQLRQRFADALAEFDTEYDALRAKVAEATSEQALNEEMANITEQMNALRDQVASLRSKTEGYFEPTVDAEEEKTAEPDVELAEEPAAPLVEAAEEPAQPKRRGLFRR